MASKDGMYSSQAMLPLWVRGRLEEVAMWLIYIICPEQKDGHKLLYGIRKFRQVMQVLASILTSLDSILPALGRKYQSSLKLAQTWLNRLGFQLYLAQLQMACFIFVTQIGPTSQADSTVCARLNQRDLLRRPRGIADAEISV